MGGEELVGLVREHVDERVADADDVEGGVFGHPARLVTRVRALQAARQRPRSVARPPCRAIAADRRRTGTVQPVSSPEPSENPHRLPRTVVPRRYDLTLEPDLDAATFAGAEAVAVEVRRADRRGRAQRHRARDRRGRLAERGRRARSTPPSRSTPRPSGPPSRFDRAAARRRRPRSTCASAACSTTSSSASTARRSPTTPASSGCSPPPSSRRPTPAGRSRAGTSPTPRRCSPSRSWCPTTCWPSPTPPRSAASRPGDGQVAVRFADTMPMSTYLVAFVVGPLEATDAGRRRRHAAAGRLPARARATSPTSRSRSARFALRYFADYYGIAYPGDKLDLVAIPDFAFGAMENLGCVTFRERSCWSTRPRPPRPSCRRSPT